MTTETERTAFAVLGILLPRELREGMPEHETAYALTVHKSQGSEFERVLLIRSGEDPSVYTGLTRVSKHVEVWFAESLLRSAISRKTSRQLARGEALCK